MNVSFSDLNTWLYGIASGLLAGIVYLLRKINTNEKQIELLKKEIETREEYRKANDEEVKGTLSELRSDIKNLLGK